MRDKISNAWDNVVAFHSGMAESCVGSFMLMLMYGFTGAGLGILLLTILK